MAKRLHLLTLICLTLAAGDVGDSFVIRSQTTKPFVSNRMIDIRKQSPLKMHMDEIEHSLHLVTSLITTLSTESIPVSTEIFSSTSQYLAADPVFEAELLNDFSHVVLDFTTFVSPNTAWIRFFNVLGRILIISSDYVPDHYISPDEAFFQASMLIISTQMFLKSAFPLLAASSTSFSVRDRRAFKQLFSRVDLSVLQYKTLLSSQTLEWIELEHNDNVCLTGDCMYWLHSGDISSTLLDQSTSTKCFCNLQLSDRLFGDVFLAKALEESMLKERPCKKRAKLYKHNSIEDPSSSTQMQEHLVAGPNGATLLRIDTPKLLMAIDHDDQLSDSINRLILLCMQEKLSRTFQRGNWKTTSAVGSQEVRQ